ncbi:hypothetical protein NFG33_00855 [Proteus mirabilis]|uniref:hypothetical protein n=1 Tax=Proteus mirabilis TaxID=584 RepID=UPI0023F787BE|nr:hypothetical protein [Proteus mirabilis]MDF7489394.1 hypothetical protein [Proteus mirabilis]
MNVDWGLTVAVLSMVFTMFIGGITIWYTKNSLDYTKKSTQIADESLKAAQKSIDTSIELYEKQKKDYLINNQLRNNEELVSLLKVVSYKSIQICSHLYYISGLYIYLKEWQLYDVKVKIYNDRNILFLYRDHESDSDKNKKHLNLYELNQINVDNIDVSEDLLRRVAVLSPEYFNKFIEIKNQTMILAKKTNDIIYASKMGKDKLTELFDENNEILDLLNNVINSLECLEPYIQEYELYNIKELIKKLD